MGNTTGNVFVSPDSQALSNALTQILNQQIQQNALRTPTPRPTRAPSPYTCPTGYVVRVNNLGSHYCQEDTSLLNTNDWEIRCDNTGCVKCSTGFFGFCYSLNSVPVTTLTPVAQIIRRSNGSSCTSGSECTSGNCASSWVESNGTRTVSLHGNVCTTSIATQNAYLEARSIRESNTVTYVAAGLAIPVTSSLAASSPITLTPTQLTIAGLSTYVGNLFIQSGTDIAQAYVNNLLSTVANHGNGPTYYSPTLNTMISYRNGHWVNTTTGASIDINNVSYLQSNYIAGQGLQHTTVTPETFQSEAWNTVQQGIAHDTATDPNNVAAITQAVSNNLTYNQVAESTILGRLTYLQQNRGLENLLGQNQVICFDYAVTEQAYLAQVGIQSELITYTVHQPEVVQSPQGHTSVLITDQNGNRFVAEPTSGYVAPYDEWMNYMGATNIESIPSIYEYANAGAPASVTPNVNVSAHTFTSALTQGAGVLIDSVTGALVGARPGGGPSPKPTP